jgi:tetratricopeptide (TPR) repeat protein
MADPMKVIEGDYEHDKDRELDSEIASARAEGSKRVEKTLKKGAKTGEAVTVAQVEIVDPEKARENLDRALKIVQRYIPFDEKDLYFKQFPGNIVGEEVEGKIYADPIMLMHPAERIAHLLLHEFGHVDVDNEAVVEAYTRELLKDAALISGEGSSLKVTEKYEVALKSYYEYCKRISGTEDLSYAIKATYDSYKAENYEEIYERYEEAYINNFETEEEKDEAFKLFEEVFPELKVYRNGRYNVRKVERVEAEAKEAEGVEPEAAAGKTEPAAEDIAKEGVDETLEEVKRAPGGELAA